MFEALLEAATELVVFGLSSASERLARALKEKRTMRERTHPTPYADVNAVLHDFLLHMRAILQNRKQFRGMYLTGSLALGDFDPRSSDIDFVVVTADELSDDLIAELQQMHARFAASDSAWADHIEAVYIPQDALRHYATATGRYPQVEKDRPFFIDHLESGWVIQCYTLREHGIVVAGPDPRTLIDPVDPDDMRRASAGIAKTWQSDARHDPSWLDWLRERKAQAFVVLTLCRLLYTLDTGDVASKPGAARWAEKNLDARWHDLIARALPGRHESGSASDRDVTATVAFIEYTVERFQVALSNLS